MEDQVPIEDSIEIIPESKSPRIIYPYLHSAEQTSCDFCQSKRSQKYKFDVSSTASRELRVCGNNDCEENFQASKIHFYEKENRVSFEKLDETLPGLLDPKRSWKVMRGNGSLEDGWKIARNWRVSCEMGSLSTLRGEPWYRIPLQKEDKVRLTFLHELKQYNSEAFAEDIWTMLLQDIVPKMDNEPSDTFLEYYPAKVYKMTFPLDSKLLELRI